MSQQYSQQIIEAYLKGKLSGSGLSAFEADLKKDPELQKEVLLQKAAYIAIQKHGEAEIRERVHHWDRPAPPAIKRRHWLRMLIGVALLIPCLLLYQYFFNRDPLNERLFEEYYAPYSNDSIASHSHPDMEEWQPAIKAYQNEDYTEATLHFENFMQKHPDDPMAIFYTGLSYLGQKPPIFTEAEYNLGQLVDRNNRYTEAAKWYLALAYLKENRIVRTKKLLQEMIQSDSYKKAEARELLSILSFSERKT